MSIFHADNSALKTNLAGDPYPGTSGNNSLTNTSLPSAKLFNANKDSRKFMGKPITDITENPDSTISFNFTNPYIITDIELISVEPKTKIYNITGQYMGTDLKKLPRGLYKVKKEK